MPFKVIYSFKVRYICLIIILSMAFSVIAPVSITLSTDCGEKILMELDVCHPDGPPLSANGTVKGVCSGAYKILSPAICYTANNAQPLFYAGVFPRDKDRPPEV
jgi:hypothetical protein